MSTEGFCRRCGREADPDDDTFAEWEAFDEGDGLALVCPGCLTREEETAIADDAIVFAYDMELSAVREDDSGDVLRSSHGV